MGVFENTLVHSGELPFPYVVCSKSFNEGNLKTHPQIHSGEHTYQWDVCKKSFISIMVLKTHQHIHIGKHP
jgi:hypothetical protein